MYKKQNARQQFHGGISNKSIVALSASGLDSQALQPLACNAVTDKSAPQDHLDEPRLQYDQRMDQVLPKTLRI